LRLLPEAELILAALVIVDLRSLYDARRTALPATLPTASRSHPVPVG
jgi:hypothetical protein